jgi:hypothetical protein
MRQSRMKYIGVADVRNPHADAWGHGGISCRQISIYQAEDEGE